ncbi:MAG TPA: DUF4878 domain-containing protein [Solirubrobacteraceae bacterium]|jgi:hypothetical protein
MTAPVKHALTFLCAPLLAVGVAACGNTVSTTAFKGESHAVAQAISQLQSDATAGDEQKICANDLSSAVVTRLGTAKGGCKEVLKSQLAEIDNFEATVGAIQVNGSTAIATVKSIYAGKNRIGKVTLVKEGGKWKLSGQS